MGEIKLSVCIPTYNRARFLDRAIRSIVEQAGDDVEIVVSDNGSMDETPEVIRAHQARFANVTYVRHAKNQGFDANFRSAVENARGRHCWSLGDDDWIEPGAFARVLDVLDRYPDAPGVTLLCNAYTLDEQMAVAAECTGAVEVLEGRERIFAHRNMGYLFGNLSINIFHRERALEVFRSGRLIANTCSGHHLLACLVDAHERWIYFDYAGAAWRYGNDSAMSGGLFRRARLALTAYPDIVADVFGRDSAVYEQFMRDQELLLAKQFVVRAKNNPAYNKFLMPYECGPVERWKINFKTLAVLYPYRRFWTEVAPLYLVPGALLPLAGKVRAVARRGFARRGAS